MSYDQKYDLFLEGTDFEIPLERDFPKLQYREVTKDEKGALGKMEKKHVIIDL